MPPREATGKLGWSLWLHPGCQWDRRAFYRQIIEGEFGPRFLPQDVARIPLCQLVSLWLNPDVAREAGDPFALKTGEKVVASTSKEKRSLSAEEQAALRQGKGGRRYDPANPAGLSPEALDRLNRAHALATSGLMCAKCGRKRAAKFAKCSHCEGK